MGDDRQPHPGISDIAVYVPRPEMDLGRLIAARAEEQPELGAVLDRARLNTGQVVVRFPQSWEDTATMAAQAALEILKRRPATTRGIRYVAAGTETTLDHSKPVSSYVQGMLAEAGYPLPGNHTNFQVQHACAAGALAVLSVSSLLSMSDDPGDAGLVLASDIARYDVSTTAEITQGAAAAAVLLEKAPRLLEVDLRTMGYSSTPVDDFFRPVGSTSARVKGQYSIQCYRRSLDEALVDHCSRRGRDPAQVLREADYLVLHAPFRHMPSIALQKLVHTHLRLDRDETERYLADRRLAAAVDPISMVGNTYAASVFLSLAFLLDAEYRRIGRGIVGKHLLLGSYGSGNTMVVLEATIAAGAPDVIGRWDLAGSTGRSEEASLAEYQDWVERAGYGEGAGEAGVSRVPPGSFYLKRIREDGYREYAYAPDRDHRATQGETSRDLHGNIALRG